MTNLVIENVNVSVLKEQTELIGQLARELRFADSKQVSALVNITIMLEQVVENALSVN